MSLGRGDKTDHPPLWPKSLQTRWICHGVWPDNGAIVNLPSSVWNVRNNFWYVSFFDLSFDSHNNAQQKNAEKAKAECLKMRS